MMGLPDRDFVCVAYVQRYIIPDDNCIIVIKSTEAPSSVEEYVKKSTTCVRGRIIVAGYEVKKLLDETVQVTALSQIDLNSKSPAWIQNVIQLNQTKTLTGLTNLLEANPVEFDPHWD
eukprot:Filipodium_phascolosomae@DN2816_c1_g1_i5.p1